MIVRSLFPLQGLTLTKNLGPLLPALYQDALRAAWARQETSCGSWRGQTTIPIRASRRADGGWFHSGLGIGVDGTPSTLGYNTEQSKTSVSATQHSVPLEIGSERSLNRVFRDFYECLHMTEQVSRSLSSCLHSSCPISMCLPSNCTILYVD